MAASLNALIPELRAPARALVDAAGRAGLQPRVTSTLRSSTEQARLYRRFLAGQQAYPVAPPGTSAHEYGYAFDMVVAGMDLEAFRELGALWQSWGGVWGGAFSDPIHFEYPGFTLGARGRNAPAVGGAFYSLADFLSGFVPILGEVQLVDSLVSLLDGNNDLASWYLQHPAEAIRDLVS